MNQFSKCDLFLLEGYQIIAPFAIYQSIETDSRYLMMTSKMEKLHYEAKLFVLSIVSGFRNKDALFVRLLFFHFL